jgi:hypothetical protein
VIAGIALLAALHQAQAANSTRDLLNGCQGLERGKQGSGRLIDIPRTREALVCWGYMKAVQDLSVWVDQNGNRILGSCPPETVTTLDLIRAFLKYGRSYRGELPSNPAMAVRWHSSRHSRAMNVARDDVSSSGGRIVVRRGA